MGYSFILNFVFPGERQGSRQSHDTYIIAKRAADALQDIIAQRCSIFSLLHYTVSKGNKVGVL